MQKHTAAHADLKKMHVQILVMNYAMLLRTSLCKSEYLRKIIE